MSKIQRVSLELLHTDLLLAQELVYNKANFVKGIISLSKQGGKRAMRVYPPWDKPESKQAAKTQVWQVCIFLKFSQS